MVRRGSAVRVRQRALQNPRKSALSHSRGLARFPACARCGALYGALRYRTRAGSVAKWTLSGSKRRVACAVEASLSLTRQAQCRRAAPTLRTCGAAGDKRADSDAGHEPLTRSSSPYAHTVARHRTEPSTTVIEGLCLLGEAIGYASDPSIPSPAQAAPLTSPGCETATTASLCSCSRSRQLLQAAPRTTP
jgi:hypothetical protein